MREEFRSRLVALRRLSPFLDRAWYSMRPMGYEELKAAIERPAALVNLQFQSGIVDDLVKKVLGQPAALPLLQFTLRTLWDRRDRNRITWEVYGKVGDPLTALKTSADTFYEGLAHETQAETRRILLELVRVDELLEAYRQPIPKSRLLEAGKANTEEVLRILTNNDYVRVSSERGGDDAVVEVKHESLIRNWPTLVAWIDEKRIERRQRIALTQASERWSRSGKPAAGLLTGWQLEEAKKQGDLSELEREFVEASAEQLEQLQRNREEALQQELVRERRRARIIRLYAVVTIVVLSILSGLMVYLFRRADNAAGVARIALAQASTQEAIRLAETGQSDEALAYIAQSLRSDPDSVAARSLVSDLLLNQRVWPAQSLSHNGEVLAVAFSSDGHRVVTASADKTARVWDTSTGQPVSVLLHEDGVKAAVFSPDGAHIVTASGTRAQLWSSTTGQLLATLKHDGVVNTATFSPDGRQVLTASSDSTAQVWNVATGARVGGALRHQDERDSAASADVLAASFSPDGRRVVTASNDATARIWNVGTDGATGRPVILRHGDKVNAAAFSPDGKLLVTACDDDLARVWSADAADAGKPPLLLRHSDRVLSAAFSSDGRSIVTSSSDGTARIWDSVSGAPIGAPLAHSNAVIAANFSPDGRRVVTASTDHTARMWNAETGAPLGTPMRHPKNVNAAAFAPDGSRLVTVSSDNTAQVWALTTGDTPVLSQHQGAVKAASFGSGHLVVIVSSDRALVVDTEIGKSVGPLRHDGLIYSAAFSTDGRYVVTASADTTARIWDVTSGALVGMPFVHDGGVTAAVFSSSGDQILTTSANNTARVWDAVTGEAVSPQLRHPGVFISSFSDDGRRVVTASNDNTTQVWDVATGQTVGEPVKSPGSIKAVTFDANAPRALIVSNVAVQIWDRATMEGTPLQKQEPVDTAAFSPDGRLIVTASQHTARVWDVATGQPVSGPLLHRGTIDEVAFSHDGSRVVVTSSDGTSLIWKVLLDLNSGESVQNLANLAELLGGFRVAPSGALVPLEEDVDGRAESNDMLRRFLDEH
jgi:WD40 repeat protein